MSLPDESDILIVGAGPAGLAAATVLASKARVTVLDREKSAGGIPRHCGHYPFGLHEFHRLMKGPAYAGALVERALNAGVRIETGVNVVRLLPGPRVVVTGDAGVSELGAERVLLATGVRESSRAQRLIGGEKPGGVLSTGALQGLVYLEGRRPFRRPVVLGTELVSFSALMTCAHVGIRPVAMIEPGAAVTARWPSALFPRLKGIPLHLATTIRAIEGRERVERVRLLGPEGERVLETDGVIVSGQFRPEAALLAESHIERDASTGGPVVDGYGRCSDPAYFAAGNLLRPVETAGWCWAEGQAVGHAIVADLAGGLPDPQAGRVGLTGDALQWVVPQRVQPSSRDQAFRHFQLRVARPVSGRLSVRVDGREVAARNIRTRPERRIGLPVPKGPGRVEIVLEEG